MSNNNIYLTLPSNSSMSYHSENTLASYTTRLSNEISFSENWEVGLAEIQFQKTWFNVPKGETIDLVCYVCSRTDLTNLDQPEILEQNLLRSANTSSVVSYSQENANSAKPITRYRKLVEVQPGYYNTIEDLVDHLNKIMLKNFPSQKEFDNWLSFKYNTTKRRITISLQKGVSLKFSEKLSIILGIGSDRGEIINFSQDDITIFRCPRAADINALIHTMYIYCDLCEYGFCGDIKAPLLRVLPLEGEFGQTVYKDFPQPRFVPVRKCSFQSIEIHLCSDSGDFIPFEFGRVITILQLRKSKNNYLT